MEWNIVRADGEIEVYNATPQGDEYYSHYLEYYPKNGLSFYTSCGYNYCYMRVRLHPTDMRYNGAQFTCIFSLPECGTTNITDPMTVFIQGNFVTPMQLLTIEVHDNYCSNYIGLLEASTDLTVEGVSRESVNLSWSPPFTLGGIPILHYTVYITSNGFSEQNDTTENSIILRRPYASITYQVTAWNSVGEGNASKILGETA